MPFHYKFLDTASKHIEAKSVESDLTIVKDLIKKAMRLVTKETKLVKTSNVDVYLHGSYANFTNIFFPSNLEVCVEVKTPPYNATITNNYFVNHNLELSPKGFRELLSEALNRVTGQICQDSEKCIVIPQYGKLVHNVEITPCISFEYEEESGAKFVGVLLHDASIEKDIATFPKLHAKNGQTKDIMCEGNFKRMVRLFKTLNNINVRETNAEHARGYFIECLLFNVPDSLFRGDSLGDIFLKVLNYLLHADISGFVCQNLVWQLFGKTAEFWNINSAHKYIKSIKAFYIDFSPARQALLTN